jgi:4-diphosphocytidyl-2-C-methyl-D-erythritol kinase
MLDSLTLESPAKINLRLEILRKRADGYHDIQTIFQKISLSDEITLKSTSQKGIKVFVDDPSIPSDSKNLAYKAASLLMQDQNLSFGLSIHIKKKIPAGAGLGGGSSNAATTLQGLNRLLKLNLQNDYLQQISRPLGADVPFFLSGFSTAHATGIGEKLKPLNLLIKPWFIIIFPNFSISTKWAYSAYSKYKLLTKNQKNIKVIKFTGDIENIVTLLLNDFESVVIPRYPEINTIKKNLIKAGAAGSLLSGSGSSVFGVFSTRDESDKALSMIPRQTNHKEFIVHCM